LPQQKPNLPRGLVGGTPSASKFSSEKFSAKMTFMLFDYIDNEILKTTKETLNDKADRAEGLLRLRDTDTSLITFREK
jgi:hypothetical protein